MSARILRERKTVQVMISMYCRDIHRNKALCTECMGLQEYALERLDRCPYQEGKTTCARCPTHCYKPLMREKVRIVMRHSGPRMILRHPILAIFHLIDGRRKIPARRSPAG